jgi:hypothetical protein
VLCCRLFAVNVKAVINVSQVVVEGMIKRKSGGSIVNVSSQASQVYVFLLKYLNIDIKYGILLLLFHYISCMQYIKLMHN